MTTLNIVLLIVAVLMLTVMIPLVPKMIVLRARVLRWFHLYRLADWHERNASTLVPIVRTIITAIALILILVVFGVL